MSRRARRHGLNDELEFLPAREHYTRISGGLMKIPITIACCLLSSNLLAQPASHNSTKDNLPGTEVPAMLFPDEMKTPNLKQLNGMLRAGTAWIISPSKFDSRQRIPLPAMLFPDEIERFAKPRSLSGMDSLSFISGDSLRMFRKERLVPPLKENKH
jgi:hypothetical protein